MAITRILGEIKYSADYKIPTTELESYSYDDLNAHLRDINSRKENIQQGLKLASDTLADLDDKTAEQHTEEYEKIKQSTKQLSLDLAERVQAAYRVQRKYRLKKRIEALQQKFKLHETALQEKKPHPILEIKNTTSLQELNAELFQVVAEKAELAELIRQKKPLCEEANAIDKDIPDAILFSELKELNKKNKESFEQATQFIESQEKALEAHLKKLHAAIAYGKAIDKLIAGYRSYDNEIKTIVASSNEAISKITAIEIKTINISTFSLEENQKTLIETQDDLMSKYAHALNSGEELQKQEKKLIEKENQTNYRPETLSTLASVRTDQKPTINLDAIQEKLKSINKVLVDRKKIDDIQSLIVTGSYQNQTFTLKQNSLFDLTHSWLTTTIIIDEKTGKRKPVTRGAYNIINKIKAYKNDLQNGRCRMRGDLSPEDVLLNYIAGQLITRQEPAKPRFAFWSKEPKKSTEYWARNDDSIAAYKQLAKIVKGQ